MWPSNLPPRIMQRSRLTSDPLIQAKNIDLKILVEKLKEAEAFKVKLNDIQIKELRTNSELFSVDLIYTNMILFNSKDISEIITGINKIKIDLSSDIIPMDKVLLHAVQTLYKLGYNFDIFVWRDATTPFIRSSDIKKSITFLRKKKCDTVCGVYKQHLNPYFNMVELDSNGFLKLSKSLKHRPRSRQEAPVVFQLNGLYTYDARKFLNTGKTDFSKCIPLEIPMETGLMIDTKFEFEIAKLLIENKSTFL